MTSLGLGLGLCPQNGGAVAYHADAVHFDSSVAANFLARQDFLSSVANSATGLFSTWIKSSAALEYIFAGINVNVLTMNESALVFLGPGGTVYADVRYSASLHDNAWHNLLVAWNTNFAAGDRIFQIYVDDASVVPDDQGIGVAFSVAYDEEDFWFLGPQDGVSADYADFYFAPGQFIDLTETANRRKFISAAGKPVDLGADGSTPTGTAPAIFFSGDAASFATNLGTGGAFTLTGSLTNAASSPSD